MTSNKTKIFIDGQHGTTGLKIHERLKDRPDIELLELPLADRKWLERDRFLRADRLIDTNSMELAVYGNEAEQQILAVASLDNLGKGASGAAVQVINLKTGVDETTGLAVAA